MKRDQPTRLDSDAFDSDEFSLEQPEGDSDRQADTLGAPSVFEPASPRLVLNQTVAFEDAPSEAIPEQIGNYKLLKLVGRGGAGSVYRAQSIIDQSIVAVKILRPDLMNNAKAVQRFEKEARMLAEVDSPYVTRLFDFGEERGRHYIVSEFVAGISLRRLCGTLFQHDKRIALRMIRDVLRALDAMHRHNVVHRDVKPENVIVVFGDEVAIGTNELSREELSQFEHAKLTDFGLARHIEQSESLAMTQQKAILGTPIYLSPEQYSESRMVDARADIYSLGATLYHMLAGVPPFEASGFLELAEMHRCQRPRPLNSLRPDLGDALSNVVDKALEKNPDMRYADASEMLADIEQVLNARPVSIRVYPELPDSDPKQVRRYFFSWELSATVGDLWPLVSDTDRLNRALGLPAPEYEFENQRNKEGVESEVQDPTSKSELNSHRTLKATAKFLGMSMRWTEHPFQWIEGRELSVLREFESGPFEWMTSTVELHPLANQRTRLIHRFDVQPRNLIGKLMAPIQIGWSTRRSLHKIYNRVAEIAQDCTNPLVCDLPFGKPVVVGGPQLKRLQQIIQKLQGTADPALPPAIIDKFGKYLTVASDASVSRIRPKELAQSFECDENLFLQLCLNATREGLLTMLWDLICPVCRIASETKDSIQTIASHAHCEACNSEYQIDFAKTVELIFRVHGQIRPTDTQTYCIGGPFHSPHVIAQNRLSSGARVAIGVPLDKGLYQIRGPQLPDNQEFQVKQDAIATRWQFDLLSIVPRPSLGADHPCVEIANATDRELVTRVERTAARFDATTAAEVSAKPYFRDLFPDQVVDAEQLVNVTFANVLLVRLFGLEKVIEKLGEVRARTLRQSLKDWLVKELPRCHVDASRDHLQVVAERLEDAAVAIQQSRKWLFSRADSTELSHQDLGLQLGFALDGGELLIGGTQAEYFGKIMRDCNWMVDRTGPDQLTTTQAFSQQPEFRDYVDQPWEAEETQAMKRDDGTEICQFRWQTE